MYYHYITLYIIIKKLYIFDCLVPPLLVFVHIWNSRVNCSQALWCVCCWWFCCLFINIVFFCLLYLFVFLVFMWRDCWCAFTFGILESTVPKSFVGKPLLAELLPALIELKVSGKYTNTPIQKHKKYKNTKYTSIEVENFCFRLWLNSK